MKGAAMEYREFRLVISNPNNVIAKITYYNNVTGDHSNKPDITDASINMDPLRDLTIRFFRRWLEKTNIVRQRDDFIVLGSHLYEILFGDPRIRQAFETELDNALKKKANPPLRLVLEFKKGARDLAELPWEFLYCPRNKGYFLGACTDLILARHTPDMYLDDEMRNELKPTSEQLRILLVISSPQFEEVPDPFDPTKKVQNRLPEIRAEDVRSKISSLKYATVDTLRKPTKSELTRRVKQFRPHVLHFIGHGQNGKLALVQEKSKELADWIEDATLADCFAEYQPHLVFLHACEGAVSGSYELFKGLALKLMEARIPTVVAMQFEVEVDEASRFAMRFYDELSLGRSIDEAVQLGRTELGTGKNEAGQQNYSTRSFGCPVVYIQNCTEEIVLVHAQEQAGQPGQQPQTQAQTPAGASDECPVCGWSLSARAKFCRNPDCGVELMQCKNCGNLMEKEGRCIECGYRASAAGVKVDLATAASVAAFSSPAPEGGFMKGSPEADSLRKTAKAG
jgi:CHAT domain-containing protein/predicted RNA-binding Zn-ribbon protein involved in translation (DUF1610 family)